MLLRLMTLCAYTQGVHMHICSHMLVYSEDADPEYPSEVSRVENLCSLNSISFLSSVNNDLVKLLKSNACL